VPQHPGRRRNIAGGYPNCGKGKRISLDEMETSCGALLPAHDPDSPGQATPAVEGKDESTPTGGHQERSWRFASQCGP